jgi:hypothetical protein
MQQPALNWITNFIWNIQFVVALEPWADRAGVKLTLAEIIGVGR